MLGAVAIFMFTGLHLNAIVKENLPEEYQPENWADGYDKVLVYYRNAHDKAMDQVRAEIPDNKVGEELAHILTWLCEPIPCSAVIAS
jgi:hypothetical protein